jgi:hypothetical protein
MNLTDGQINKRVLILSYVLVVIVITWAMAGTLSTPAPSAPPKEREFYVGTPTSRWAESGSVIAIETDKAWLIWIQDGELKSHKMSNKRFRIIEEP